MIIALLISAIKKLVLFFEGKKDLIIAELEKEMKTASKQLEFERANKLKKQIFALTHIRDTALISSESFEIRNSKFPQRGLRVMTFQIFPELLRWEVWRCL